MVGGACAPRHRWRRSIQHARLPSHSQGYCSTHERPGTWRSSPRDQYWSLTVNTLNLVVSLHPKRTKEGASQGPPRGPSSPSPKPSRNLPKDLPNAPCRGLDVPKAPQISLSALLISNRRLLGLLQTSFRLSGPSAYTNEKVFLLTKMDLIEFRS